MLICNIPSSYEASTAHQLSAPIWKLNRKKIAFSPYLYFRRSLSIPCRNDHVNSLIRLDGDAACMKLESATLGRWTVELHPKNARESQETGSKLCPCLHAWTNTHKHTHTRKHKWRNRKTTFISLKQPVPVAARSKAWKRGRSLVGIAGSNPAGGLDVCCECCVLSGRGLCDEPITRLVEPFRVCECVIECDQV